MLAFFYICEYLNITPKEFFDFDIDNPEQLNNIINDLKTLSVETLSNISAVIKDLKK